MPVYQYACTECDEELEVRQSFTDDALTVCPVCEGRLRKVLNAVGVVFKGSGFYRNDSRVAAGSSSGAGAGSGSDPGTSSSKAEKTGDKASPATKGESAKGSEATGSGAKESKPKSERPSGTGSKGSGPKPAPAAAH